jgi:hypothetical protein
MANDLMEVLGGALSEEEEKDLVAVRIQLTFPKKSLHLVHHICRHFVKDQHRKHGSKVAKSIPIKIANGK